MVQIRIQYISFFPILKQNVFQLQTQERFTTTRPSVCTINEHSILNCVQIPSVSNQSKQIYFVWCSLVPALTTIEHFIYVLIHYMCSPGGFTSISSLLPGLIYHLIHPHLFFIQFCIFHSVITFLKLYNQSESRCVFLDCSFSLYD